MRKFKLQVQVSVDGYMAGPNGEMDWTTGPWTSDLDDCVDELMEPVDTIVLGRKLAEGFIPHWANAEDETQKTLDQMNKTPRVVISNTLTESPWENAVIAGGDLTETITKLKDQPGGDMIVFGGGTLVRNLVAAGLIDEFNLFVNTAAIGEGMPVFPEGAVQQLRLTEVRPFKCGITLMRYELKRD